MASCATFASLPAAVPTTMTARNPTITICDHQPLLCFIVDDNSINLLLLKKMLVKTFNCEVLSASMASECLAQVREHRPIDLNRKAIVLTDIHMPEMDGIEMTAELRVHWSPEDLPIFGVTADFTGPMRDECLRSGMQGVIAKPLTCLGLLEIVKNTLTTVWGDMPEHFIKPQNECPIPNMR